MNLLNESNKTIPYTNITIARGDGIGPEIMDVALKVLSKAGARIKCEFVEIGESLYQKGYATGISDEAWDIIKRNRVMLKAPMTTPQGGGFKSINVTLRKTLGLYANVRPTSSYHPFILTKFPTLDIVVVRENEEDLYAGIEYQHTEDCCHAIKMITRKGCEKIVRYAFEYAVKNKRKKVTCMTKDNIMKITDGLFHKVFNEIGEEYPNIEKDHYILDIGFAKTAVHPELFDVIVTLNLYGDVLSDIVAEMSGSVGLGGSSNIGSEYAMFEAIHGSAPAIVGQQKANPTAILNAAVMMLAHIGQGDIARKISNAILYTIESGYHTQDIFRNEVSKKVLNTTEFGDAVIENLGKVPSQLKNQEFENFAFESSVDGYRKANKSNNETGMKVENQNKKHVGVDLFIAENTNAKSIGEKILNILPSEFAMKSISSRGMKSYPADNSQSICSTYWCCRIVLKNGEFSNQNVIDLLTVFHKSNINVAKTENLYDFNDIRSYSVAQGE